MHKTNTMWMIVLLMMVLTRTRSEDDSHVPITQSLADGSASTIMPRPNHRRKRNSTNTRATTTEQPVGTEQVDIGQSAEPPKRRGPSLNLSVTRTLENLPEGSKIPLIMDKHTIAFIGTSATDFATECGIIMRNFCPMNYQKWDSVLEDAKALINKMEANRAKQVDKSRGGSRSIANHTFQMINPETQMPPSPLELYHKLHFNAAKQGWLNENSHIEYENIIQHKQATLDELNSKGTTITTAMEHQLEKEAIKSVCGRKKTIQSTWEVGVGPVLRKKDGWMKSVAESSQRDSNENESQRNKVIALEPKQK